MKTEDWVLTDTDDYSSNRAALVRDKCLRSENKINWIRCKGVLMSEDNFVCVSCGVGELK